MVGVYMIVFFIILALLKVPIWAAMASTTVLGAILGGHPPQAMPLHIVEEIQDYTLLAIPFFLFAGSLMNTGGITQRIFDFSNSIIGFVKGGLAHVNVLASMIFSGISGTALGDAGGLGIVLYGAMDRHGYDRPFSASLTLASSLVGPLIPPSVPFIIYAMIAEISVLELFIAGAIPGLLVGLSLMFTSHVLVSTGQIDVPPKRKFDFQQFKESGKRGFLALLAPVIILWGMLGGVITPTEAGIVAIVYAILLGFIYKELNFSRFKDVVVETVHMTTLIMFMIGIGFAMSWVITRERVPQILIETMTTLTENEILLLLLINILLLILGMIMDAIPVMLVATPLLLPLIDILGVDRVQFGVIITLNTLVGLATPPIGLGMYIVSSVTKQSVDKLIRALMPFYVPMIICLLLVTFIPALTLWLPNLLLN